MHLCYRYDIANLQWNMMRSYINSFKVPSYPLWASQRRQWQGKFSFGTISGECQHLPVLPRVVTQAGLSQHESIYTVNVTVLCTGDPWKWLNHTSQGMKSSLAMTFKILQMIILSTVTLQRTSLKQQINKHITEPKLSLWTVLLNKVFQGYFRFFL